MEEQIKRFLNVNSGSGYGSGYGYGSGSGDGSGYGDGYGSGSGSGDGDGSGYGDGSGDGSGSGSGSGSGYGYGFGDGFGDGSGSGSGYGYGYGYGFGDGIKMINRDTVYMIDNTQTIIKQTKGDVAKGFILQSDLTLTPTYVVKRDNKFAHGETLHDAHNALMEKLYDDSIEEERIEAFNKQFSDRSEKYHAKDLFHWHHVLTGSCKQGRLSFCKDRGIDLDHDMFTIGEFVEITKNSYGGSIIKKLLSQ